MSERRRRFISTQPAELWSPSAGLWECPACGKLYARLGQGHSCVLWSTASANGPGGASCLRPSAPDKEIQPMHKARL